MARVVFFCQPIAAIISSSVAPPSRLSIAITWLVLLPSRGAPAFVATTGVFWVRGGVLLRGRLLRRDVARLWRNGSSNGGFRGFGNDSVRLSRDFLDLLANRSRFGNGRGFVVGSRRSLNEVLD